MIFLSHCKFHTLILPWHLSFQFIIHQASSNWWRDGGRYRGHIGKYTERKLNGRNWLRMVPNGRVLASQWEQFGLIIAEIFFSGMELAVYTKCWENWRFIKWSFYEVFQLQSDTVKGDENLTRKWIWKEEFVVHSKVLYRTSLAKLRKSSKILRIAGKVAKMPSNYIRTQV